MTRITSWSIASAFALALVLVMTLAGCGDSDGGNDDRAVITFWHFWSEPAQKAALEKRIKAFEEANPGVRVELGELSWADGKTKLLAAFNSNTAPDLLELGSDWIAQFSSGGVLADIGTLGGKLDQFAPEVAAPGRWENGTFALPWVVDTRVLFVNRALLAAAGQDSAATDSTWEQLILRSEAIKTSQPNAYGFGVNGEDRHRLYKKILPFFWSNGGELLDAQGQPVIDSPENIEALETYLALARSGVIDTQKKLDDDFMQGKIGYLISGSWLVERIRKDNPSLKYSVTTLPSFPGRSPVSFAGGEYLAINEASDNKQLAMKLATFLTSAEQALAFCKDLPGGMTPADRSTAGDPFLQGPVRSVFTRQLAMARMTPVHPRWLDIEEVIENEVSQALLGNKTSTQALNDAQARVGAIIREGAVAATEEG
jgi:multiple sugar transport system substrate-binding protein